MLPIPQLKSGLRCEVVSEGGIVLVSEQRSYLFPGKIYCEIAPYLDGQHTFFEVVQKLDGEFSPEEVVHALVQLRCERCIVDADSVHLSEHTVFWEGLGVGGNEAAERLTKKTASINALGKIAPALFHDQLTSLGIHVSQQGELSVVLTDDYLHRELLALNQDHLYQERPWMLVKPVGTELWLGPLFVPGKTGCWECLAHRLRGTRKVEQFLQEKTGTTDPLAVAQLSLPSTVQTAFSLAATEVAKWVVRGKSEALEGRVVTLDALSLEKQSHLLIRRPQCPSCGDPKLVSSRQSAPIILQDRTKALNSDGGHRGVSAQDTLKQIRHHVSPVTGIVNLLQPVSQWVETPGFTPPYVAGHNFFHAVRDYGTDWDVLSGSLQDSSFGKGRWAIQSQVSAICEAVERYSGVYQGDEARIRGSYKNLGHKAVHPNACMLYSEQQYARRNEWNRRGSRLPMSWVPHPFDEEQEIEWSPVWSLTSGEVRYVPMAYCYYGYARKHDTWFARADSNGCAAGHSIEEAIVQGYMELVERDSVALWWYNRLRKPAVDLSSFEEPYFKEFQRYYHSLNREVWVLDITSDLGIPAFAALSRRLDKEMAGILFGFGAHFDLQVAVMRALAELDQQLPVFSSVMVENENAILGADEEMITWWQTARVEEQVYLSPDETASKVNADYPNLSSDDFRTDVETCVTLARKHGLEVLVLDQTRPDIGLSVVKVMVPGLRHFWARFAPGRLYDVPVQMGWLPNPRTEDELNPEHIYV